MGRTRWALALLVIAPLAVVAVTDSCADRRADLYTAGQAAVLAERWDDAIENLRALLTLDADYHNAPDLLAQAFDRSVVPVPAGPFLRGNDDGDLDERPRRSIVLDAFEIDRYEITNVQYRRFLLATSRPAPQPWPDRYVHLGSGRQANWRGAQYPKGEATLPVVGVRWQDAADYCTWAGKRLPSEAEWEKAARGIDGRAYPWGNDWDASRANTAEAGVGYPRLVGSYPQGASPYGALDMAGNAWEWVADWYDRGYYRTAPRLNPPGPPPGAGERVLRGGAYDSTADQARSAYRNATHFFGPNLRVGFRCARDAPAQ